MLLSFFQLSHGPGTDSIRPRFFDNIFDFSHLKKELLFDLKNINANKDDKLFSMLIKKIKGE